MLRCFTRSRTTTTPRRTLVRVPAQVSVIVHCVPRTLAVLLRPRERKRPCTFENSRRFLRAAVSLGEPPRGTLPQERSPPPVIDSVVSGFFLPWPITNRPPLKWPS